MRVVEGLTGIQMVRYTDVTVLTNLTKASISHRSNKARVTTYFHLVKLALKREQLYSDID